LGNGAIQSTTTPVAVTGGLAFATLGLGSWHSCGVTVAGVAYCWGENFFGKLGNGSTVPSSVPVKVAGQP
jgi:alpha-tubulin suppressor-like RCC1 family protein